MAGGGLVAIFVTQSGAGEQGSAPPRAENHGLLWALKNRKWGCICVYLVKPSTLHHAFVLYTEWEYSHIWAEKLKENAETKPDL